MGKQKYKIVSELLSETMREVSLSEENWCRKKDMLFAVGSGSIMRGR